MKDNRAFILSEDKAEEFLNKHKKTRYIDADKLLIEMEKKIGETSASILYYTVLKDVVNSLPTEDVLEQEPCEDAISRQSVLDLATTIETDDYSGNELLEVVEVDDIKALPPVTPTRKKGKWIFKDNSRDIWCSNCDASFDETPQDFNFCPCCGADMRKVKE